VGNDITLMEDTMTYIIAGSAGVVATVVVAGAIVSAVTNAAAAVVTAGAAASKHHIDPAVAVQSAARLKSLQEDVARRTADPDLPTKAFKAYTSDTRAAYDRWGTDHDTQALIDSLNRSSACHDLRMQLYVMNVADDIINEKIASASFAQTRQRHIADCEALAAKIDALNRRVNKVLSERI
jgi:hypothetical protein